MALFDAYIMVDWSAAATPRQGADSIWIAVHERVGNRLIEQPLANPPTRAAAMEQLADLLSDLSARGATTLLGCDFNFGYPQGFAARLDERHPTWLGLWRRLAALAADGPDNANDRFGLAARLNGQIAGGPQPFWGCPATVHDPLLSPTKPAAGGLFPEFRLCERRVRGVQPVWKLWGAGSVGSQTLLGIPRLLELRQHPWLERRLRVWPFETGLAPLARPADGTIILAEVYPSLLGPVVGAVPSTVKDAAQVTALCRHFATRDQAGRLGPLFAGDPALTPAERAAVEGEEGWILGVTGHRPAVDAVYLQDPAAIYARSFAIIRAETDLSRFAGEMEAVALRVIQACGMPEIAADLAFSPGAAEAGSAALAAGKPILVDAQMVAHGIIRARLPAANPVLCFLDDPRTAGLSERLGTTRSAAAVTLWRDHLEGAVVAIGNAPTALFQLFAEIAGGAPRPALILGFPVGFVGAAESKEALIAALLPHICLRGRRGGSAMAAAAVNALAGE